MLQPGRRLLRCKGGHIVPRERSTCVSHGSNGDPPEAWGDIPVECDVDVPLPRTTLQRGRAATSSSPAVPRFPPGWLARRPYPGSHGYPFSVVGNPWRITSPRFTNLRSRPQGGAGGSRPFTSYLFQSLPGQPRVSAARVNPACYLMPDPVHPCGLVCMPRDRWQAVVEVYTQPR
jgi:hypothetical protein